MAERNTFAGACINLFSHLWAQLELIATESPAARDLAHSAPERRVEILRLELVVLLDACRATRWRMLLNGAQRHSLEQHLRKVLECLNTGFDEAPLQAVGTAQNCLLDAVLEQHRSIDDPRAGGALRRATA